MNPSAWFSIGKINRLLVAGLLPAGLWAAAPVGADIPWITYEAEAMKTTGTVRGPKYEFGLVETESSGQRCVELAAAGAYAEFTATAAANTLVLRYSLPDARQGVGVTSSLELLVNGRPVRTLALTSRYAHLYGNYPFTNNPADGKPRNFYDELRVKDLALAAGDVVRLQKSATDAPACIVDLVDLENIAAPLAAPANSVSVRDFGAKGDGRADDTAALRAALAAALAQGRIVWAPPGDYKLTGDIVLPSGATIQGAGMWHTSFVGDAELYPQAGRRVRFKLAGQHVRLADFSILGKLNYRNDDEPNDGLVGANSTDSEIARIWVEHTKTGAWIYNGVRLRLEGCRFRNLLADGVNLCVSTSETVVENCTARGTGDDCFAIWPVAADQSYDGHGAPAGHNVIRRCTGSLPFLAQGAAIYGGDSNRIEDCLFTDITASSGVLISTTFPTSDPARKIDNNFSGTTVVRNVTLVRCGGKDHSWGWRGALQVCLDHRSIAGLAVSGLVIRDSLSSGVIVTTSGNGKHARPLSQAGFTDVQISGLGLSGAPHHAFWIQPGTAGTATLADSPGIEVYNESADFNLAGSVEKPPVGRAATGS